MIQVRSGRALRVLRGDGVGGTATLVERIECFVDVIGSKCELGSLAGDPVDNLLGARSPLSAAGLRCWWVVGGGFDLAGEVVEHGRDCPCVVTVCACRTERDGSVVEDLDRNLVVEVVGRFG